jgi:CheY-like chemotaxis protein
MGASILVLEDDEAVGRVIGRRLEAAGHHVRVFAHAGPALDHIDGGAKFDLYLLDVAMPSGELHGLGLARMLTMRFADPRIVFVTGNPHLIAGPDKMLGPVFAKPIDFKKLLAEIERLLPPAP